MSIPTLTFESKGTQYTVSQQALREFLSCWKKYQPNEATPKRPDKTIRRLIESGWEGRVYPRERSYFLLHVGEKVTGLKKIINAGWNFFLVHEGTTCDVVAIERQR